MNSIRHHDQITVSGLENATDSPDVVLEEDVDVRLQTPWHVIVFNDEIHTFEEVITQIIKATGCSHSRAEELTLQVHHTGKAGVYDGEFEDCLRVQGVLREIQLVTEIQG